MDPLDCSARWDALRGRLDDLGQSHLLAFFGVLGASGRAGLLEDLESLPWDELAALAGRELWSASAAALPPEQELLPVSPLQKGSREAREAGLAALARGEVAAVTVAGGQASRLGFEGPKGAFPVGPVSGHTLFRLFAEQIRAAGQAAGRAVPWYVMTSFANHAATVAWFEANDFAGLARDQVRFFPQGKMPCFGRDGRLLLSGRGSVAFAPDGHGGLFNALDRSGMLREMSERGVTQLSCFQVDNPLVHCLDPEFVGMQVLAGTEISCKSLPKQHDREALGSFCLHQGRLMVVEYSDLPESMASSRQPDGSRRYDAGSISIYVISRAFAQRMAARQLPWHHASKRVPYVDLETGAKVEPSEPNAVKLERFLFDVLPLASGTQVVNTSREEEFGPVKNLTGVDSVATSRQAMVRRAARWLQGAGVQVPMRDDGEPDAVLEISPLVASDQAQLRTRELSDLRIERRSYVYLGPGRVTLHGTPHCT